jgi:ABC-2 type transport system permease protein
MLLMQIRRELWEHRSLWIAPLLVGILLLLTASSVHNVQLYPAVANAALRFPPLAVMLFGWGVPFYVATGLVVVVYLLDCLYGERRDRSILFWRSLPVSDTQTVLAKLLVGLVVVPLGTFLLVAVTSALAIGILGLRHHVLVNGRVAPSWDALMWLRMQVVLLYALAVRLLWYAPYAAYLMLASAWARRSPYAWAFVPPILLAIFEYVVFGASFLGRIVQRGFEQIVSLAANIDLQLAFTLGDAVTPPSTGAPPLGPSRLIQSPQLWLGLVAAALMLVLVVRLRRYRDES